MEPRISEGARAQDRAWSALMVQAQDGDGRAYAVLLAEVAPFVRAIVRRKCREPETVEDVVQDVLLAVHRVRRTYDPARSFSTWIAAIAARRAVDALRRRGRLRARETADQEAYETFADPAANKEDAGEAAQLIVALLAGLPARQREALELVKVKEMSLVEASSASGQSVGALKVNVHRAIKALRARLGGAS